MGWLDHSTNNIILDAVLTDYGRQKLSAVNGAFKIASFSLGDDEVDYRIVKKYGRTVGKEKIEKNTPIFEALTNPNIALKYKLIGRESGGSAVSTVYLTTLEATPSTVSLVKSSDTNNTPSATVSLSLVFGSLKGASIPGEVLETEYTIKVSDRFFKLSPVSGQSLTTDVAASSAVAAGDPNRTATYKLTVNPSDTSFSFKVEARSIDNTTLSVYGKNTGSGTRQISSYITVTGQKLGCSIDIPISYTASTT